MSKGRVHQRLFQTVLGLIVAFSLMWAGPASALIEAPGGDITTDTTWAEDVNLTGIVNVKAPAVLTIAPGVTVYGAAQTAVIIEQGAKIMAIGTPEQPIVFTSNQPEGSRARGDWGGVSINGYAPTNASGGSCPNDPRTIVGEAGMGVYGGCQPYDSSGILRYVRIEYAGFRMDPENEWNALTLQGVGDETIVEYVQCHQNADDGIEFFGGTVNVRNILNSECDDDHFDWTHGFAGEAQFIVAHLADDTGDRGIEADNLADDTTAEPISNPSIYNMTLVGNQNIGDPGEGILLRRGTGVTLKNSIVTNFQKAAVDLDNEATFARIDSGDLVVDNSIFYNNLGGEEFNADESDDEGFTPPTTTREFITTTMANNRLVDPQLTSTSIQSPDLRPSATSPALTGAATVPADGFFVESADFIGAFDSEYDWTKGWTTYGGQLAKMPVPSSFVQYSYQPQNYPYTSANPKLARPISFGFTGRGKMDIRVGLHAFAAPMDIYVALMLPDGTIYAVDENIQLRELADMQPWKQNQSQSVYETVFSLSDTSSLQGTYAGYVLAVPAGTNVMGSVTSGYLWSFTTTI
jgi:hypothetical protein